MKVWFRKPSFPDNWKHDKTAGNESFTVTLNGKNFLLNYKTANGADFGEAEVYVDGEKVMTLQGRTAGGWNNSNVVLVIDEDTVAEHTIEVRRRKARKIRHLPYWRSAIRRNRITNIEGSIIKFLDGDCQKKSCGASAHNML